MQNALYACIDQDLEFAEMPDFSMLRSDERSPEF
jgi:hypothetical protein